jgi:hypothetical protein
MKNSEVFWETPEFSYGMPPGRLACRAVCFTPSRPPTGEEKDGPWKDRTIGKYSILRSKRSTLRGSIHE